MQVRTLRLASTVPPWEFSMNLVVIDDILVLNAQQLRHPVVELLERLPEPAILILNVPLGGIRHAVPSSPLAIVAVPAPHSTRNRRVSLSASCGGLLEPPC